MESAKKNDYLKYNNLRFKENLTAFNKESLNSLWLMIERARKEGKSAYFAGAKAFVNEREMCADA
jgi:hypothetical protein